MTVFKQHCVFSNFNLLLCNTFSGHVNTMALQDTVQSFAGQIAFLSIWKKNQCLWGFLVHCWQVAENSQKSLGWAHWHSRVLSDQKRVCSVGASGKARQWATPAAGTQGPLRKSKTWLPTVTGVQGRRYSMYSSCLTVFWWVCFSWDKQSCLRG